MNAWLKSLLWAVPREQSAAALPVLTAGCLALGSLALAYFSPPTRGELERSFGETWIKQTCAAAASARCRITTRAADTEASRLPWVDGIVGPWKAEREQQPAKLVVLTTLEPQSLQAVGARTDLLWPRMRSALQAAAVEPYTAAGDSAPTSQHPPATKRRTP